MNTFKVQLMWFSKHVLMWCISNTTKCQKRKGEHKTERRGWHSLCQLPVRARVARLIGLLQNPDYVYLYANRLNNLDPMATNQIAKPLPLVNVQQNPIKPFHFSFLLYVFLNQTTWNNNSDLNSWNYSWITIENEFSLPLLTHFLLLKFRWRGIWFWYRWFFLVLLVYMCAVCIW